METNDDRSPTKYSTFRIGDQVCGIEALQVQEFAVFSDMTPVPLSPSVIAGLINLRGQIATAVNLSEVLQISTKAPEDPSERMSVVCNISGDLYSFIVDQVEDVVEMHPENIAGPPNTLSPSVQAVVSGVIKLSDKLITVINVAKAIEIINQSGTNSHN